jgi:serine/arginine repetitive matrix protein 2
VQLKNRFAEQRARGAQNQISEEEEDMILETLGKIHSSESENGNGRATNGDAHHGREETDGEESSNSRESAIAGSDYHGPYERSPLNTTASSFSPSGSSVRSSPSSRSAKRYSNNLFGSGRMLDYNYIRSRSGSQRSVLSATPAESGVVVQGNSRYSDRPITPDGEVNVDSSSTPSSSMNDKTPVVRSAPLNPPGPYNHSPSAAEYRISRALNPAALKRASLALEEALKEIEEEIGEEAEDEIVMPRSVPASRRRYSQQSQFSGDSAEVRFFCNIFKKVAVRLISLGSG